MPDDISKRIDKNNLERRELMIEALVDAGFQTENAIRMLDKGIPQSQLFMSELIPLLHRLYGYSKNDLRKSVLDVGPQAFGGTQLLSSIHSLISFSRLKLDITALDITPKYKNLAKILIPEVELLIQNIFDIEHRVWDVTIASHVIEHVPNPVKFVKQLQELTNDYVLVAAPWNENPLLTNGHINTINKELTFEMEARDLSIFTNYSWGKDREVCSFWLPGKAKL